MNQNIFNTTPPQATPPQAHAMSKTFMANVFSYMFAALAITGVVAYLFGTDLSLVQYLVNMETGGFTALGWVVMIAPIGLVILMSMGFHRLSSPVMLVLYIVYSILMGMSLSFIFWVYDIGTIYLTFGVTSATFGAMAVLGYTTKTDLTKFGGILYMALIGLIIAMVVNWFMNSSTMDYLISIIGVLIFTGLTAYDVQKLKRIGTGVEYGTQAASKLAIMGAVSLYLDFINLFLFLLRLFGGRD